MIATICREFHFNAAHRLHNRNWTDEKNKDVFGKCNNLNYHGHNYQLVIKITGEVAPETGFVLDIKILKDIVEKEIIERFDHKNLNLDTEEFRDFNPTAEHIAYVIYQILKSKINYDQKLVITLYETERNYTEYSGE